MCLIALAVNAYGIGWGLPNDNQTWAADSIKPGAPLSIIYRIVRGDPWNSGWFWFKYPLGHILLLTFVYAPYLGWLMFTGALSQPTSVYPHGFADPESAFAMLALLGRSLSAVMGAGCAALVYLCLVRSFGRLTAFCSALLTALCYPVVFYSHTTNVEIPYLFWMLLSLLAAIRLVEGEDKTRWWACLALGAAMSVSTKELAAGAFVGLPLAIAASYLLRQRTSALVRGAAAAAAVFVVTLVVANNVLLNPSGFVNRLKFLTQTLEPQVALQYAPYYFPIELGGSRGIDVEWVQLGRAAQRVAESVGFPTLALSLAGLLVALRRRPGWTSVLAAAAAGFYLVGVRAMLSLSMRYVLPLSVIATMLAGVALAALLQPGRVTALRRALAVGALAFTAVYGWDVDRMLVGDGRYGAEAWISQNVAPGQTIEVYQRPTYLPRFPDEASVRYVDYEDRGPDGLAARRPDYVLISSAGLSGISVRYKTDWQSEDSAETLGSEYVANQVSASGKIMNYARRSNLELLAGLTGGTLGYEVASRFMVEPWIERPLIESLNPEITIYRRVTDPPTNRGSNS